MCRQPIQFCAFQETFMASSSRHWDRDGWTDGWSSTHWSDKWQQGEDGFGSPAAKWQRGSDGSKWSQDYGNKWQAGTWSPAVKNNEQELAEVEHVSESKDPDEWDEERACRSRRLRPPKRVREYQKELTRRLVREALEEEQEHEERCPSPPCPPPSPPPMPPMPPTFEEVQAQYKSLQHLAKPKVPMPPKCPPPLNTVVDDGAVSKSGSTSITLVPKATGPGPRPKQRPTEARSDHANFVASMKWIVRESKLMNDELDSGLFLEAPTSAIAAMTKDWREIREHLTEAYGVTMDCMNELERWLRTRNSHDEVPDIEIGALIETEEQKDMKTDDHDAQ